MVKFRALQSAIVLDSKVPKHRGFWCFGAKNSGNVKTQTGNFTRRNGRRIWDYKTSDSKENGFFCFKLFYQNVMKERV